MIVNRSEQINIILYLPAVKLVVLSVNVIVLLVCSVVHLSLRPLKETILLQSMIEIKINDLKYLK